MDEDFKVGDKIIVVYRREGKNKKRVLYGKVFDIDNSCLHIRLGINILEIPWDYIDKLSVV